MDNIQVDGNGRAIPIINLGYGDNFNPGDLPEEVKGIVRIKNIGSTDGYVRLRHMTGPGVCFSPGETEYFYIERQLTILSGTFNVMW